MKQKKSDAQFMMQFDQKNRDFLTMVALYTLSLLISASALLISLFSLIYSLKGLTTYTIIVAVLFITVGAAYWLTALPLARKSLKDA